MLVRCCDAVAALAKTYKENINVLEELSSDDNQPAETRTQASGIVRALKEVETSTSMTNNLGTISKYKCVLA